MKSVKVDEMVCNEMVCSCLYFRFSFEFFFLLETSSEKLSEAHFESNRVKFWR